MTWWKILILAVLGLGVVGVTVAGLKDRPPPAVEVQITRSKRATISRTVVGAGKVQAATTVKISSTLSGDLIELAVKDGDRVKKGQVLGRIDPRRFQAAAKQMLASQSGAKADVLGAQVDLDRTTAELARVEALEKKGLTATADVEKSKSDRDSASAKLASSRERLAQANAQYEQAATDLGHTTLLAPMDGNIIELDREVGERVRGSDFSEDTLMVIAALAVMEVKIEVGEHEVVWLKNGQLAEISIDALEGQSFKGNVVEIAQRATVKNPGTESEVTSFPVTVALQVRPNAVLPGMSAEVHITADTHKDAVTVPIQAVTVRPDKSLPDAAPMGESNQALTAKKTETLAKVVFVVDGDNKTHARRVQTGIASDTELEVTDGLKEGERVVEGPFRTLSKELQDDALVKEGGGGKGPPPGRS